MTINDRQHSFLERLAAGEQLDLTDGPTAKTVYALRDRGLATVTRRDGSKTAAISRKGHLLLLGGPQADRDRKPATRRKAPRLRGDAPVAPSEDDDRRSIAVPQRVRRWHPSLATHLDAARQRRERDRYGNLVSAPQPVISIAVSKPHLRRAMLLLQALFTEAERRGHTVDGDRIVVAGHGYAVSVTEKQDRTVHEPTAIELADHVRAPWLRIPQYDYTPNGLLQIHLPKSWARPGRRRTWSDGKRALVDAKLDQILAEAEARAVLDEQHRQELARKEREREQTRQEAERRAHLQAIEEHRAAHVADCVSRWQQANAVRSLCAALDAAHGPSEWTTWARQHAERLDPTRTGPPALPYEPKQPTYPAYRTALRG